MKQKSIKTLKPNFNYKRVNQIAIIAVLATMISTSAKPALGEPLKEGDRVVFLGDSITHNGLYHSFLYLFYQTRYPEMPVDFFNCGVSGGRTVDALDRLQEDVLSLNPDVVVVNLGMNDVGTSQFTEKEPEERDRTTKRMLDRYQQLMSEIVLEIKQFNPEIRIILTSPSPYDQTGNQKRTSAVGKNDAIAKVTEFLASLADDHDLEFVDFHSPINKWNKERQASDPDFSIIGRDRVHPGPMGHLLMAAIFLDHLGTMESVSEIELNIDSGSAELGTNKNVSVENLEYSNNTIRFNALASSLPYPIETVERKSGEDPAVAALDFIDFQETMNREILKVSGLENNDFELRIDGEKVGVYSGKQLAEGISLAANSTTPQYQQAFKVAVMNEQRRNLERPLRAPTWVKHKVLIEGGVDPADEQASEEYMKKWRNGEAHRDYRGSYDRENTQFKDPREAEARRQQIAELVAEIYSTAKPRMHSYEILPATAEQNSPSEENLAQPNIGLEKYNAILGFENFAAWDGMSPETDIKKSGATAVRWDNTVDVDRIRCRQFPPDVARFNSMHVWVYSEKATDAVFAIVFRSENDSTDGPDYHIVNIPVDWTGWKKLKVNLDSMSSVREPAGLGHLTEFLMASSGYRCGDPHPETSLVFDQIEFY